jgi:HlyD family secretion protein
MMVYRPRALWRRWAWLGCGAAVATIAAAWSVSGDSPSARSSDSIEGIEWVAARRMNLDTTIVAGGELQATSESTVVCQVEDITDAGGFVILSMVENSTPVLKGDELCRLDSSELEAFAREDEINLGQKKSACVRTKLTLEAAQIALRAYQEGLVTQKIKELQGRIALGKADTQKMADRLRWSDGMLAKGYLSRGQLLTERQLLAKSQHELSRAEGELELFRRFTVPRETMELQAEIGKAERDYRLSVALARALEEELAYIRTQIDRCVIRAPKDGIVRYSRWNFWRRMPLEPGVRVRENQELFHLPDLSQMEVEVSLNESVGPRAKVGMPARVEVASLAGQIIPGRVTSITPLSDVNWRGWDERVRHFIARVRLDVTPPRLLPFMSASVEIDTGRILDALVIPVTAMTVEGGRQCCYVLESGAPERRWISTGHATTDLIEVTMGLRTGERVVVDPRKLPRTASTDGNAWAGELRDRKRGRS